MSQLLVALRHRKYCLPYSAAKLTSSVSPSAHRLATVLMCAFDWDEPYHPSPALEHVDRSTSGGPVMRTDFADQLFELPGSRRAAGVRHITYLSAFGKKNRQAPATGPPSGPGSSSLNVPLRSQPLPCASRLVHANFRETFLNPSTRDTCPPLSRLRLRDAEDIASVYAAHLASPTPPTAPSNSPTGPAGASTAEATRPTSSPTSSSVPANHNDIVPRCVIAGVVAVLRAPPEYG